jgi:hypothetical protein
MSIKQMLLALIMLFTFSSAAMADADFTKSAIQMGTSFCPNASFDCDNLSQSRAEIIAAANECAETRLDFTEKVMSDFSSSGQYENCAIADHPFKDHRGVNNWAICCVKKNGDKCEMSCTRYIDQK